MPSAGSGAAEVVVTGETVGDVLAVVLGVAVAKGVGVRFAGA